MRMFRSFEKQRPSWAVLLGVTVLTIVGAAMRLYGLSNQSFWFDEVCSWHTATQPTLAGVWSGDLQWNMYPPLYGFVLRACIAVLGGAEWAMRLPSALAGIATIPLMYLVAARIFGDMEGLIAAGFTAFSMFTLYFAQEARPYALLLLAVLIAVIAWTYMYEAWSQRRRAPRAAIAICWVASVCAAYLHYFGMLFVALHCLATITLLARNGFGLARACAFYAGTAIAFAPWLPNMLWQLRRGTDGPQNPPPDANVAVSFWHYVNSLFNHGQTADVHASAVTWIALVLVAFGIVCETIRGGRREDDPNAGQRIRVVRAALLVAWLVLPFLIAYVKSSVSASVFTHRNLIVSLPAVYLLAAHGIARLPLLPRKATTALAAAALAAMAARTLTSGYYSFPHKDQFREAVAAIAKQETRQPNAILVAYAELPFAFDYHLECAGSKLRPSLVAGRADHIDAMRALVRDRKPAAVWYLCTTPFPDSAFAAYLDTEFTIVDLQRFLRADAMLLVPK